MEISFNQLKKNSKKCMDDLYSYKFAILGDCATQHLATALKGYAYTLDIGVDIFDADYNQIDAQLLDESSELFAFKPDFILLYMCTEKLYEAFFNTPDEKRTSFAAVMMDKIISYWADINKNITTHILQFNFVEMDDRTFGNYCNNTEESFLYQIRKLNCMMMDSCQAAKNVFIIDLNYIQSIYGRNVMYDNKIYGIAKMPLSTHILPQVAKQIIDMVLALLGKVKKCVVVDLDNTLWGGVIGDDGMEGIQIGELGTGHAFTDLQIWLKELKRRGIILAVCSKNDENIAKEPFINHPEMVLHLEDISVFVANWDDKVTNINYIQKTLNIGMDSIVFLDDNPFERNLVKSQLPQVTVPELPEDPALYLDYLRKLNLFETASYSSADKERTKQYQEEMSRSVQQKKYASYDDYLVSLEMTAEAKPFDTFHYSRIAQLSQRSNQFNLRTIRYTEAQVEAIAKSNDYLTLYFTLCDKFGSYGLISEVVMEKRDNSLFIVNWLMSCRVLKRGVEEFIINKIIKTAEENGYRTVVGEYIPTAKNAMVSNIYEKMRFTPLGNGRFSVEVETFVYNKTYIKEDLLQYD